MSETSVFVHPQAIVDATEVGNGTRVWAFVHVCKGAVIGSNCNIGDGCYIESGSRIGNNVTVKNGAMIWEGVQIDDDAFIGPGVVFTNDFRPRSPRLPLVRARYETKGWLGETHVGRGASIGANATINCGIRIGEFSMIGAGSIVTTNVPAHALVFGNPARLRGYVCACGGRLQLRKTSASCSSCGRKYRRTGRRVSLLG